MRATAAATATGQGGRLDVFGKLQGVNTTFCFRVVIADRFDRAHTGN
jgi:hypothetical protein